MRELTAFKIQENINGFKLSNKILNFVLTYGFYILFGIMILIGSVASPVFFTYDNLMQIVYGGTSLMIVAAGATFVIITGNMDLSVGSVGLMSMAVAVLAGKQGIPFELMLYTALLVGSIIGLINGVLIAYLKMNSMLTTLGMMIALRGLALNFTNGGAQVILQNQFKLVGSTKVLGINVIIIFSIIMMIILHLVLRRSKFGAHCYAVGCNKVAAERIGLPVRKVTLIVYILSGVCAAFAGIISCAKLGTYSRTIGMGMEFDVISVCVIGGTSLLGGRGKVLPGTLLGILIIYLINNGLTLFGASPFIYPFAKGLVIFVAMYIDALKSFKRK